MPFRTELATDNLLTGLPRFAEQTFGFPGGQAFLDWFFGSPNTRIFVSHDAGEWHACIGVFDRTYSVNNQRVPCYETYAWASLPKSRAKGLGIKAIKAAMSEGRPLIVLGGSEFTEEFMPRLGFDIVGHAPSLFLPLRGRAIVGDGVKRSIARMAVNMAGRLLIPSRPADIVRYVPVTHYSDVLLAMDGLPGFHACPDRAFFEWQDQRPDIGHFLPLTFVNRSDELIGWCYARISEEDAAGGLVGRILETTFFPRSTPQERDAMMRLAVRLLAGCGVIAIRALTTCPDTIGALRKLHFQTGRPNPAMVYRNGLDLGDAPARISVLRADGGVLPTPYSLARYGI